MVIRWRVFDEKHQGLSYLVGIMALLWAIKAISGQFQSFLSIIMAMLLGIDGLPAVRKQCIGICHHQLRQCLFYLVVAYLAHNRLLSVLPLAYNSNLSPSSR